MFRKLLLTVGLIALVWFVYRALSRRQVLSDKRREQAVSQDMEQCAQCQDFVIPTAGGCADTQCPYSVRHP